MNNDFAFLTDNFTTSSESSNFQFVHPNIRHLHLDIGQRARFQLSKVFHTFPNLVELNIANVTDEPRKNFTSVAPLKYLSIRQYSSLSFSEKLISTLAKLDLRLERLLLVFHPPLKGIMSKVRYRFLSVL